MDSRITDNSSRNTDSNSMEVNLSKATAANLNMEANLSKVPASQITLKVVLRAATEDRALLRLEASTSK